MKKVARKFDLQLGALLTVSGVDKKELAEQINVPVVEVNRWLGGVTAPDLYQFQAVARFFGMPYEWFLSYTEDDSDPAELAEKLGLSPETVGSLMALAADEDENESVLDAVDTAIQSVLAVADAVWEDLDRYTDQVVAEAEAHTKNREGAAK